MRWWVSEWGGGGGEAAAGEGGRAQKPKLKLKAKRPLQSLQALPALQSLQKLTIARSLERLATALHRVLGTAWQHGRNLRPLVAHLTGSVRFGSVRAGVRFGSAGAAGLVA